MSVTTESTMPLEQETRWFDEQREHLVSTYFGKFLVIKGSEVRGSFDTAQAAYEAGVRLFGQDGFLLKQALGADVPEKIPALWAGAISAAI